MLTHRSHIVHAATVALVPSPLAPGQLVEGTPVVRTHEIADDGVVAIGVWEHTIGASRDVEVDEVFVVLSGRATIAVTDGPTLEVGPGDVGILAAGDHTIWTVHEDLRKVYVLRSER